MFFKSYKRLLFLISSLEIFRILNIAAKYLFSLGTSFFVSFLKLFKLFHKVSKKAGTRFILFQSRNTIGRLMKSFLHRPIEDPLFPTRERFKMF